jgi:predicted HTH domain antitoxin
LRIAAYSFEWYESSRARSYHHIRWVSIELPPSHPARAAMRYHRLQPSVDPAAGLPDEALEGVADAQERYNLVLMHYLGGAISLGLAAELLELPALVLQMRFARLDIPVQYGPETLEEARADVAAAASVGGHG